MRTTVRIDDEVLRRAKALAARTGRTLTAVIEDALRAALANAQPRPEAERIEIPTYGRGGVRPGVDLDDTSALLDLMESDSGGAAR